MSNARGVVLRIGVISCIAVATGTAAVKLNDTLAAFDLRADRNAGLSYSQRSHTHPEWSAAAGVVLETARLWMPEDATYRIVFDPDFDQERAGDFTHLLLINFLLPRRPTTSGTAQWAFCYGCTAETLGGRFQELAHVEGGPTFGRIVP